MIATNALAKANRAIARRWWVVASIAVVGGLIATIGYAWVDGIYIRDSFASTTPGLTLSIVGWAVLIGALVVVRFRTHPRVGGHIIWISVGVAGAAMSLNLLGTSINDPTDSRVDVLFILSFLAAAAALAILLLGSIVAVGQHISARSSRSTAGTHNTDDAPHWPASLARWMAKRGI